MPYPNIDPVVIKFWKLEIRWYGIMYLLAFITAFFVIGHLAKKRGIKLTGDDLWDYIFYLMLGVIIGGRLGYCLFYWPGGLVALLSNPLMIFAVWLGGMSFHGGFIGVILAVIYCSRRKGIPFYDIADITAVAGPIGIGLGRIGNFINGELWGRATDVPWCMVFPLDELSLCRHPSQLYESLLEGLVLFLIIFTMNVRGVRRGIPTWSFIAFYGLFRFSMEFFRQPDPHLGFIIGPFSMGQLLTLPMMLIGGAMIIYLLVRGESPSDKKNKGKKKEGGKAKP
ncbi:MAG: prolipoprotein diacylglyceryl transferase [Deltaproteobacteria bacterium]|uniref:Phosphatidylglycerol--prolipoprotein diacylglyceryl transferase n=1 Tax=Candidatus Zymogenus saltonus TaxID=2844893 RepID=A0A9D8KE10_9DELT|nr:prolipoprotein diacylglyceryl transferase [Candidatus Zymogenus saltonus]